MAMRSGGKTSETDSVETMLAKGKARRETSTKLPEGYAMGGVPGGRGGGMHVGRSGHTALRQMGAASPASMSPMPPVKKNGNTA